MGRTGPDPVVAPDLPPVPSLHGRPALRRSLVNGVVWAGAALALAVVVGPAVWVIGGVVARAVPHWQWAVLTTPGNAPSPALPSGGLENEVLGTLLLMGGTVVLAGTVGILSGIHLAEHLPADRGGFLRGASEILAGVPSIVLGYVGYIALVVGLHWGYSLLAGLIVLVVFVVPYIAKSTEVALRQVPTSYREGAEALGMPPAHALRRVALRSALPGITTGLIVAVALAAGETAPLLFTANYSDSLPSLALTHHSVGYLTYAVWTFFNLPTASAVRLSYDAALLLIVLVLVLMVASRVVVGVTQRQAEPGRAG